LNGEPNVFFKPKSAYTWTIPIPPECVPLARKMQEYADNWRRERESEINRMLFEDGRH